MIVWRQALLGIDSILCVTGSVENHETVVKRSDPCVLAVPSHIVELAVRCDKKCLQNAGLVVKQDDVFVPEDVQRIPTTHEPERRQFSQNEYMLTVASPFPINQ